MAYQYSPPANFPRLSPPAPGTRGHFDHHENLEAKLNTLESHTGVQITTAWTDVMTVITALTQRVTDLETELAALKAITP